MKIAVGLAVAYLVVGVVVSLKIQTASAGLGFVQSAKNVVLWPYELIVYERVKALLGGSQKTA